MSSRLENGEGHRVIILRLHTVTQQCCLKWLLLPNIEKKLQKEIVIIIQVNVGDVSSLLTLIGLNKNFNRYPIELLE